MKTKTTILMLLLLLFLIKANCQSLTLDSIYVTNATTCSVCNGSAMADMSGGIPPYTYVWSDGETSQADTGLCPGRYSLTVYDNIDSSSGANYFIIGPQPPTIAAGSINTSCSVNTGSVFVNVYFGGGTGPFTYSWSPGGETTATVSGLSSGTYSVTVTNTYGCSSTTNAIISGTLQIIVASSTLLCSGGNTGTVSVTNVSGGVSPYTYLWTPTGSTNSTVSNLIAGYYTVTVTDNNGCVSSALDSVLQPYPISIQPGIITGTTCSNNNGNIVDTLIYGGTLPYTYSWSPSGETTATATGLASGTYTLTVTDINGCTGTRSAIVPFTGLFPAIITGNDSCNGESNGFATINSVSGGIAPYTYSWTSLGNTTNAVTGLTAGNYSVTITDNTGCSATSHITIAQPGPLSLIVDTIPDTGSCSGVVVMYGVGGTGPYTFTFSLSIVIDTGGGAVEVDSLCYGSYYACITDAHGCTSCDSVHIRHDARVTTTGNIKKNISELKIYPNPANDMLFISTDGIKPGNYNLNVYDMIGRQLIRYQVLISNYQILIPVNVSGLSSGKYMLRISGWDSNKMAPFIISH